MARKGGLELECDARGVPLEEVLRRIAAKVESVSLLGPAEMVAVYVTIREVLDYDPTPTWVDTVVEKAAALLA